MLIQAPGFIPAFFRLSQSYWGLAKRQQCIILDFRAAQGDKADFRLVHNIAHRLKIHQLWSYQGGILQRIAGDLYTLDGSGEKATRCNIVKNVNQLSFIDLRH